MTWVEAKSNEAAVARTPDKAYRDPVEAIWDTWSAAAYQDKLSAAGLDFFTAVAMMEDAVKAVRAHDEAAAKDQPRRDEIDQRAREYIDAILEINRRYGHDGEVSQDEYERAVQVAAEPARRLSRAQGSM